MKISNIEYNTEKEQSFFVFNFEDNQYLISVEQKVSFFKRGILAVQTIKGKDLSVQLVPEDPFYDLDNSSQNLLPQMVRDSKLIEEFIKFIVTTNERLAISQAIINEALENAKNYEEYSGIA